MNFFDRLSDYDILAYLPQGLLALAALDYAFGTTFVLEANWSISTGVLAVIGSYVAGHIIAAPSSRVVEHLLTRRWLGNPTSVLFERCNAGPIKRNLFKGYFTPLARSVRDQATNKIGISNPAELTGDELFWTAYPEARTDPVASKRLSTFLGLYGFCRNLSFLAGVLAAVLLAQAVWIHFFAENPTEVPRIGAALGFGAISLTFFWRYLKFYRLYAVEVFVGFTNPAKNHSAS